jgi:RimJ/RimL family protein N-acetyltransferase
MLQITLLADHPDVIPKLAQWFQAQWPAYYAERTLADIEQDFRGDLNRDRLPLRLIAFAADELTGTIVLRERGSYTRPEHQPELGGLYVATPLRGRGVGTELVRAGMVAARELGYQTVYATTHTAGGILGRLGWEQIGSVQHAETIPLYRCDLSKPVCAAAL